MQDADHLGADTLPDGIRSRMVDGINGLNMHILEAGYEAGGRPCLLLLHGFPELAYSWRKVMMPLAAAGYHVVAPDQRGFARSSKPGAVSDYAPAKLLADLLALADHFGMVCVEQVEHVRWRIIGIQLIL
mgnify:CR=1 FL=1